MWLQEEDVHFERDASGQLKELGSGAFGKVPSDRASKPAAMTVYYCLTVRSRPCVVQVTCSFNSCMMALTA